MNDPKFPGITKPSIDIQSLRDGRRSTLLHIDVDLSSARSVSAGSMLILEIAGNAFYVDQSPDNGNATVHFQDTNLAPGGAPVYVLPGFIARVPFTRILIENDAQAGKRLRIFYGIDVDFVAGMNASISLSTAVPVRSDFTNSALSITTADQEIAAANASRNYLFIQNNHATANVFIGFGATAVTAANGIKLAPGAYYELNGNMAINAVRAIGDAANTAVVMVEG